MNDQIIELTREELYRRVWESPMTELSKEFGKSDVWINKVCRRYGIPTPPKGYHLMADGVKKKRRKVPLPEPTERQHRTILFRIGDKPKNKDDVSDRERWLEFKAAHLNVASKSQMREIERMLKAMRKPLHLKKVDERGILRVPTDHPIRVSPDKLPSALETLRSFLLNLVDYGASVPVYDPEDRYWKLSISWLGYDYRVKIEEFSHRVLKPQAEWPDPKDFWYSERDKYKLVPNGKLQLEINLPGPGYIRVKDGKTLIKDRLDDIMMRMFTAAQKKAEKDRIEAIRKEKAIAFLKEKDAERRMQEFEVLKQKQLVKEARHWHRVNELRLYLEAVERAGPRSFKSAEEWRSWLQWSNDYLDSIDPLKQGLAGKVPDYPAAKEITSVPMHYLQVDDPEEAYEYYQSKPWTI